MRVTLSVVIVWLLAGPALAREPETSPDCDDTAYDGPGTDAAGALVSEPSIESAAAWSVSEQGIEIPVVVVTSTGADPQAFAAVLGNCGGGGPSGGPGW